MIFLAMKLLFLGSLTGFLSGFFGIGGGTILVPLLLLSGFETKVAIGIAILQMVFSSIYGSYLNKKNGSLDLNIVLYIALGGFLGALASGGITSSVSDEMLELVFLGFATFALIRLFIKVKEHSEPKEVSKSILFLIGFVVGAISLSVGVGGSLVIVPILVGFLHVPIKKAISAGLFFVVFSSLAGFASHYINGHIDFTSGIIIGLASLVGVYFGIAAKQKSSDTLQRKLIIVFYISVVSYLTYRIFF